MVRSLENHSQDNHLRNVDHGQKSMVNHNCIITAMVESMVNLVKPSSTMVGNCDHGQKHG